VIIVEQLIKWLDLEHAFEVDGASKQSESDTSENENSSPS
jgi:hypothetical protein